MRNLTSTEEPRQPDSAPTERSESPPDPPADDASGTGAELADEARAQARALEGGPTVSLLGAEVPRRTLVALGVFVVVFLLVWVALWGIFGGAGLVLGWIVATAAGGAAVWLLARRTADDE